MIAGAGAVATALMLSPVAAAEPAPPPPVPAPAAPAAPAMPFANQLAGLGGAAPQLIQGIASALTGGGGQSTLPVDPITPAPTATASLNLPQAPGAATALPAAAAAAPAVAGVQNLVPQGLASLLPAGTPLAGLLPQTPAATPAAPAAPGTAPAAPAASPADAAAQSLVPMFLPVSALP